MIRSLAYAFVQRDELLLLTFGFLVYGAQLGVSLANLPIDDDAVNGKGCDEGKKDENGRIRMA